MTSWMRPVETARDLGIITDIANGPHLAFTPLNLPEAARQGLSGLNFHRDYGHREEVRLGKIYKQNFTIDGWTHDPADSALARRSFAQQAAKHLPFDKGRNELLACLGWHFAQLASGLDRRTLSFTVQANPVRPEQDKLHQDNELTEYVALAYLTPASTPAEHAPPDSFNEADYPLQPGNPGLGLFRSIPLDEQIKSALVSPPAESLCAWRGLGAGAASAHRSAAHKAGTRIALGAYTSPANNAPALRSRPGPFAWMRNALSSL